MPIGGAHIGFWSNRRIMDRSITKSKNVLIVYDPNSIRPDMYTNDVNPSSIASTISSRETALTFIPATVTTYSSFLAIPDVTVENYAHIWDVGYDTYMTEAVETKYANYLATGGAMFLLGENGSFVQRDGDITNFITNMGGGSVTADAQTTGIIGATVASEFLLANQTSSVTSSGNGTHAAVWKTGSLSNKPTAAIASVLDINFLVGLDTQNPFIDNLSIVLNQK